MTIEIADRLIKLRKKNGYSQEELADKLGLSRQAVSKWERAEASPDTDNLICLAKLYGVSLDELLSTDEDIDTIVKEQVKADEKVDEESKDSSITLEDDDGSKVVIKGSHMECLDKDGHIIKKKPKDKFLLWLDTVDGILTGVTLITYIFLGAFLNMWAYAWIFFFVPEIICSFIRAIHKRNANNVNMAFISLFIFFLVCLFLPNYIPAMSKSLWHPMWTVFLAIPLYHSVVGSINKALGKKDIDDKIEVDKVDE